MAAAAEVLETQTQPIYHEVYAESIRNIRVMGRFILDQAEDTEAYQGAETERWHDFIRGAGENLATDPVYGERLRFDHMDPYEIKDGHVRDREGLPIVDMVREGWRKSKEQIKADPENAEDWEEQAVRDEGDVMIAHIADGLEVGEMLALVSAEPKKGLQRKPKFWRGKLHYREGLSVVQVFYRSSEDKMLAGAFAIKRSNHAKIREIMAARGVHIPENESPNRYSRYGIRATVDENTARKFGNTIAEEHGQDNMVSVTKLLNDNRDLVWQYFTSYIKPLAAACASGNNTEAMSSLASAMLRDTRNFSREEITQLIRVANSSKFNDDDARAMEKFVRYALVEEIRKQVPALLQEQKNQTYIPLVEKQLIPQQIQHVPLTALNQRLALNINDGLAAGRSYGGCSGVGRQNDRDIGNDYEQDFLGLQDVFGGKAKEIETDEDCEFISKSCPECGAKNVKTVATKTHISGSCGCRVKK